MLFVVAMGCESNSHCPCDKQHYNDLDAVSHCQLLNCNRTSPQQ